MKWRPFEDHFEDNWRPIIKLSVVSSILGCNNFGPRKIALKFLYLDYHQNDYHQTSKNIQS